VNWQKVTPAAIPSKTPHGQWLWCKQS